jgi:hypothetical protein
MAIVKSDFEQLMNQARVKLVGASEAGLRGEFYDVLSEFFNDSSIWTEDVLVPTTPNTFEYPVSVPEGQIIRLVGVCQPAVPLTPPAQTMPDPVFVPALMAEIGTLQLKYSPSTAVTYSATFVVNTALPTSRDDIPLAPSWVLPVWHVGILDGLLGKMMGSANKSYSNPTTSAYHLKRFRDAIARARISKLRANTNGAQAWRFPQAFRTGNQQGGVPSFGGGQRTF